ncbi:MAG: HAMP domain-containing histidine kinase [Coriobacteriales bacterium]|jgi:signal transduction histidine kinase|nr:HAMP domain-containing histidine kinase [Coriobacteriales bacterium]
MIRQLRIKFVAITMGILILVFVVSFATLNVFMQTSSSRQTQSILEAIVEQDGFAPATLGRYATSDEHVLLPGQELGQGFAFELRSGQAIGAPEVLFRQGRFFYAKIDHQGAVLELNTDMMFEYSLEELSGYVQQVVASKTSSGTLDGLQYLVAQKDYGSIIAFAQRGIETLMLGQFVHISLIVAVTTCVLLFLVTLILSRWIIKPVQKAFDRQSRFVSDASHELATPLTIITTNVEVLEHETGKNQRLTQIKEQSQRMGQLLSNLLTLARSDEARMATPRLVFDLSATALSVALEFESRAFEEKRSYTYDLAPDLNLMGDEAQTRQLIAILIDNALKHSDEGDTVRITLENSLGTPTLCVYNTGVGIAREEYARIFDRFYRSDESRSRETGGYGLGLSIAQAIAEEQGIRISVDGELGSWISFTLAF